MSRMVAFVAFALLACLAGFALGSLLAYIVLGGQP